MRAADFFDFARKRHAIYLDRAAGRPEPWTDDPILGTYRFTNVFRELDRTTEWFRVFVRDHLAEMIPSGQLLGTILFRTFNRIETAEIIFRQFRMEGGIAAWEYMAGRMSIEALEAYMRAHCPAPWVTGAYIVKTPDGMDKLRGALWIIEQARQRVRGTTHGPTLMLAPTLQTFHRELLTYPYLGGFTAYEIVSDLRHLPILREAPDILSWAHAGPGAVRGLNRLTGREVKRGLSQTEALREMRYLLAASNEEQFWPGDWPRWEMREVEHTLCEFDKYERVRLGEGTPRGRFR